MQTMFLPLRNRHEISEIPDVIGPFEAYAHLKKRTISSNISSSHAADVARELQQEQGNLSIILPIPHEPTQNEERLLSHANLLFATQHFMPADTKCKMVTIAMNNVVHQGLQTVPNYFANKPFMLPNTLSTSLNNIEFNKIFNTLLEAVMPSYRAAEQRYNERVIKDDFRVLDLVYIEHSPVMYQVREVYYKEGLMRLYPVNELFEKPQVTPFNRAFFPKFRYQLYGLAKLPFTINCSADLWPTGATHYQNKIDPAIFPMISEIDKPVYKTEDIHDMQTHMLTRQVDSASSIFGKV